MISVAQSSSSQVPQESDWCNFKDEETKSVLPKEAPPEFGVQATQEELQEINLGTDVEPRPTFINKNMSAKERKTNIEFLKQNAYVFA